MKGLRLPEPSLPALGYEVTKVIHENLGAVMAFAFSRSALREHVDKLHGYWKYLEKALFEYPEQQSVRAVIELAVMYRALDDVQDISSFNKHLGPFGELWDLQGRKRPLSLRAVANKVIHAERIEWGFSDPSDPRVICYPAPNQTKFKWTKASISISRFAAVCGGLMS